MHLNALERKWSACVILAYTLSEWFIMAHQLDPYSKLKASGTVHLKELER